MISRALLSAFAVILLCPWTSLAEVAAPIKVVATIPDLAWLAKQLGQDAIKVESLLTGHENPHYVDAVPDFVRQVADADVIFLAGLDLEIGWLPKVLERSGNAQVQAGGKGYCEAGEDVAALERPGGAVDRSMGHVHPSGNPHFWLDPLQLIQAAGALRDVLSEIDPKHAASYHRHYEELSTELKDLHKSMQAMLAPVKGVPLMQYHSDFSYLIHAYGLNAKGTVEDKPGVLPAAGQIAKVGLASQRQNVKAVLATESDPRSVLQKYASLANAKVIRLPTMMQPDTDAKDYQAHHRKLVQAIVKGLQE